MEGTMEGDRSNDPQATGLEEAWRKFEAWANEYSTLDVNQTEVWIEDWGDEVRIVLLIQNKEYRVIVKQDQMDITALASFLKNPR